MENESALHLQNVSNEDKIRAAPNTIYWHNELYDSNSVQSEESSFIAYEPDMIGFEKDTVVENGSPKHATNLSQMSENWGGSVFVDHKQSPSKMEAFSESSYDISRSFDNDSLPGEMSNCCREDVSDRSATQEISMSDKSKTISDEFRSSDWNSEGVQLETDNLTPTTSCPEKLSHGSRLAHQDLPYQQQNGAVKSELAIVAKPHLNIPNPTELVFATLKNNLKKTKTIKKQPDLSDDDTAMEISAMKDDNMERKNISNGDTILKCTVNWSENLCQTMKKDPSENGVSRTINSKTKNLNGRRNFHKMAIAPSLHDNLQYHAYFLYHNNDRNWVLRLIERLETPALGFRSCCFERNFDIRTSPAHVLRYGTKHALKTVIVLSPDFVSDNWCTWEMVILSQVDVLLVHRDILVIVLQECDIPEPLSEYACVDVSQEDWWTHLVAHLCSSDHSSGADQSGLTSASSLVGLNPRLQSGHLLASIKSRCYCCGKEVVDDTEIPEELISFGIQVPQEEYREAISHLMLDAKFSCHVWCYNVPAAIAFFTLLLGLCLSVIPLLEIKFFYNGSETGLEFVHGGVVWLCSLTVYMVIVQISKRKMKVNIYKRLCQVNTQLIKYNVLAGLENLGLADCNKYYVHFFYFEIGPCLGYLQELMVNLVEGTACFQNQTAESPEDVSIEMDCDLEQVTAASDKMRVLDSTNITNSSVQTQAEDLLLGHSGEYVSLLITKKLERPHRQRHVAESPCLCQFVEHRVYKMIV